MDLFDDVTQYQQFFVFFLSKQKNHLHRSIYYAEFAKSKFHTTPFILMKNMALKLVNIFTNEINIPEFEGATLKGTQSRF